MIDIVAMRYEDIKACEQDITPTTLHENVALLGRDIGLYLILSQKNRLHLFWSESEINHITAQHVALLLRMGVEQVFQISVRACSLLTTFKEAWGLPSLRGLFKKLREFCGGDPLVAKLAADLLNLMR